MPNEFKRIVHRPMTGGMVTSKDARFISSNDHQLLSNFFFVNGLWRKRPGLEPLYSSNPVQDVTPTQYPGTIVGLFRHYRVDADKYSFVIVLNDTGTSARLLGKKNDTMDTGEASDTIPWTLINSQFGSYSGGAVKPDFFKGVSFGNRLLLTDGINNLQWIDEYDGSSWAYGRLGAIPPKRKPNYLSSVWDGNPIFPGGFAQYCYVYAYEDDLGKIVFSNPSPRSPVIPLDWMADARSGFSDLTGDLDDIVGSPVRRGNINTDPTDFIIEKIGPTSLQISGIGIGREHMTSATDLQIAGKIVRRDIYRRTKGFADEIFTPWEKVGTLDIKDGIGGEGFHDLNRVPPRDPLKFDNNPPPRAKEIAVHKNRVMLMNYTEDVVECPAIQSDETYPYYEDIGLIQRARMIVVNNTNRGYTDAVVRLRVQWHDSSAPDYVAIVETGASPQRDILFTDDDGKTILPFYRESWKESGYVVLDSVANFAIGDEINNGLGVTAIVTKVTASSNTLYLEKMSGGSFGVGNTIDNDGAGSGVVQAGGAIFNEAIFVIRVPELSANGQALLWIYYNVTADSITDQSVAANLVYHRLYATSDMRCLVNCDGDYPMPVDNDTPVERISCQKCEKWTNGGFYQGYAAPIGNDENLTKIESEQSFFLAAQVNNQGGLSIPNGTIAYPSGTFQFFFKVGRPINQNAVYAVAIGGGIVLFYQNGIFYLRFGGLDENYTPILTAEIDLHNNYWYFMSIGWDGSGAGDTHFYVREVGSLDGQEVLDQTDNLDIDGYWNGRGEKYIVMGGYIRNYRGWDSILQMYLDEIVQFNHVLSLEEVECRYKRRDLDSWYYAIKYDRAADSQGWNQSLSTCKVQFGEEEDVGQDGDAHLAGLAISDSQNAHVYKHSNRRIIGNNTDPIKGGIEADGDFYIYKLNSTYRLRTDGPINQWMEDDAPIDQSKNIGLAAPLTLRIGKINGIDCPIGMANDGQVYFLLGGNHRMLSYPISDQLKNLTDVQKKTAIGFTWKYGDSNLYVLGIGTGTARTGWTKLSPDTIGDNVIETLFFFDLDTVTVSQLEDGEEIVRVKVTKGITAASLSNKFKLGYPCIWDGPGDNGQLLFGHGDIAWIYVWGERTGNNMYYDNWAGSNLKIPIQITPKNFWHERGIYKGWRVFYKAQMLVGGSMEWVNDIVTVIPKTYDELQFDNTTEGLITHTTKTSVISGGRLRGKPYTLPRTARGEWLQLAITESVADGIFIWEGLEYYVKQIDRP